MEGSVRQQGSSRCLNMLPGSRLHWGLLPPNWRKITFQAVEQQLCWKGVFDELLKAKKAYRQGKAKIALPSGIRWPSGCMGGRGAASKSGVSFFLV